MSKNKVLVVSGGVSGLGFAAAVKFANCGYAVGIVDVDSQKGNETQQIIRDMGHESIFCACDISSQREVTKATEEIQNHFGRTDVLINNASLEIQGSIMQCDERNWDRTFRTNLLGLYNMSNHFIPMMIKQGGGSVINVGSILAYRTANEYAAYSSSKGAIDSLTKSMAYDLAKYNVRVNCVAPGAMDTERLRKKITDASDSAEFESMLNSKSVFNRMGRPEEAASVIYFLASDEASFMTGTTCFVDGGWSIM